MAWRLAYHFDYTGVEPDSTSHAMAARRLTELGRGRLLSGTTELLEPRSDDERYDLVCGFEVLEHLADDVGELARWHTLLRPRGHVLLSVPAHRHRFSAADAAVGHYRRYDRGDLQRVLEEARFDVLWIEAWGAGLGHALEGIRNCVATVSRRPASDAGTARSGRWLQPRGRAAAVASAFVALPFRLLQRPARRGAVGIGWVALARRIG